MSSSERESRCGVQPKADAISTSDTKLAAKSLIADMTAAVTKLYVSPQGRRSLFYLLVPRTRRHFTPAQIAALAETDETRARTSKKETGVRESEVRKFASEALISWVEEKASSVVREPGGSLVVTEIMLFADGGLCLFVLISVQNSSRIFYR